MVQLCRLPASGPLGLLLGSPTYRQLRVTIRQQEAGEDNLENRYTYQLLLFVAITLILLSQQSHVWGGKVTLPRLRPSVVRSWLDAILTISLISVVILCAVACLLPLRIAAAILGMSRPRTDPSYREILWLDPYRS